VIHPTYRSLDAPVKLLGLAWRQWIALLAGGGALIAAVHWLAIPTRPAISLCTIVLGVPVALAYLSEETGFGFGRLVCDMARWRLERHRLAGGGGDGSHPAVVVDRGPEVESRREAEQAVDW
jgi:hypothetical protein